MSKVKIDAPAAQPPTTYGTVRKSAEPATAKNTKAHGAWVLVRFEAKPKHSEGGLHLPLSQQVEPNWARCVSVGHRVKERIPAGARLLVAAHMNGDRGPDGTHWLEEKYVLGVEES